MTMTLFHWSPKHVAAISSEPVPTAPLIYASPRVIEGIDIWDHWPVLDENGELADIAGGLLVIALSAPVFPDPDARHGVARLRLLHRRASVWTDLGNLLPDGFSPGSREWAGSAVVDKSRRRLTLYFTAAGRREERAVTFEQRLFETSATLNSEGDVVRLGGWTDAIEMVRADGVEYEADMTGGGAVGTIKAFRDPYHLRDNGREFAVFAASRARAGSAFNGLVGLAMKRESGWTLLPPVVDATGVANELERPHAVRHGGLTYLFWSSQSKVFAPGLAAPTGLYGVVGDRIDGPWRPLNGHGLVFANPDTAPAQAYSWQVLPDLSVWSFADMVSSGDSTNGNVHGCPQFRGTPAPVLSVALRGHEARLTS